MSFREQWGRLTSGTLGYIIYAVLGIFAAYLFYFGSGFILHTDLPFVAVVSGSMDHGINDAGIPCVQVSNYTESFDNWWQLCGFYYEEFGINKTTFENFPFSNGFKIGDMPIIEGSSSYKIGDVIVYTPVDCSTGMIAENGTPIIHRIIKINPDGTYQTKGDHNSGQNNKEPANYEECIKPSQIHGKVIFILPKVAYLKVILNKLFGV